VDLAATPRREPFIWVSWLAKVMTSHSICEWQYWFQTHNKLITKHPSTFDSVTWQIGHTRLLSEVKRELSTAGLRSMTEFGCEFRVPGVAAKISGKTDCLVNDGSNVMIYDCKTGKPRDSDRVQVMIYMYGLSTYQRFASSRIRGTVVYRDERVEIPYLPDTFGSDLSYFADLLAEDTPPERQPGQNCEFCNIAEVDCPERV